MKQDEIFRQIKLALPIGTKLNVPSEGKVEVESKPFMFGGKLVQRVKRLELQGYGRLYSVTELTNFEKIIQ